MVFLNDIKQFFIKIRIFDLLTIILITFFFFLIGIIKTTTFHPSVLTDLDNPIRTDTYTPIVLLFYLIFCGAFSIFLCHFSDELNFPYSCFLYYIFGLNSTALITMVLKNCIVRPRPDTLAICGSPYSDDCKEMLTYHSFFDQYQSFPSGHSAFSMSSSIFLYSILNEILPVDSLLYIIIKILPLFGSLFISLTRVWDFKHHTEDVVFGSFLGAIIGLLSFKMFQHETKLEIEQSLEERPYEKGDDFLSAPMNADF